MVVASALGRGLAALLLAGAASGAEGPDLASLPFPVLPGPPPGREQALVERLARLGSRAEALLRAESRTVTETRAFRVLSDVPDAEVARKIAHNLEATWSVLDGVFGRRPVPGPGHEGKILVYLFETRAQYASLSRHAAGASFGKAFYSRPGLIALHAEAFSREDLLATLLHEGTHAYVDRCVARPGHAFPPWLNEGLAEYLAASEVRDGRMVPGVSQPLRTYHGPQGSFRGRSRQRSEAILVRRALRRGEALPLADLVAAGPELFTGPARDVAYPQASMFVHFLRHGRPEWRRGAFPALVRAAAAGRPSEEAIRECYGASPAELERAFRRHVRRL